MASGGFKPNAPTDFLEEWKAKREKMRAKMLGDIAAITSANVVGGSAAKLDIRSVSDLNSSNGNSERAIPSHTVARSSSSSALARRAEEDAYMPAPALRGPDTKRVSEMGAAPAGQESDVDSPKGKEKKSSGPSARKGKGQIEKRKLREKRRSTGVVNIPSNESLDELDDDDGEKDRRNEEELTQQNTVQNESMTSDSGATHSVQDSMRCSTSRHKVEEELAGSRQRQSRPSPSALERRIEELERELALERQESAQLLKSHQDKDDLIVKLKEEIDLLNRDLDDLEDENEQLKQENKTLLKVVGQLTR